MSDLTLHLDVRFTPGAFRVCLAALLLSILANDLGSESVTMTTYYPAPSGVYNRMITTGDTYLARDPGGRVSIGMNNLIDTLTVGGNGTIAADPVNGNPDFIWRRNGSLLWQGLTANGTNNLWFLFGLNSVPSLFLGSNGQIGVGTTLTDAKLTVSGGAIHTDQACNQVAFNAAGFTPCAFGQYATYSEGVWSRNTIYSGPGAQSGTMYCCQRQ